MGSYIKTILILIVLVFLVTFGIQNNKTMILDYYFQLRSMPIPVYAVVYGSLLVGIFIGMIVGISARFAQRKKIRQLQKENRNLKNKVAEPSAEKTSAEETAVAEKDASLDETGDVSLDETQAIPNEPEDEDIK